MKKISLLFILMGIFYVFIEVSWTSLIQIPVQGFRLVGSSSLWMMVVGGFLGVIVGGFNQLNWVRKTFNVFWQSIVGATVITSIEFLSGLFLNVLCGFNIWDYSSFPLNILGQVCLPMSFVWFCIVPLICWTDDTLRYVLYKEGSMYNILDVYKDLFKPCKSTNHQATL